MQIFEFTDNWNLEYFLGMLCIAFAETVLLKCAIRHRCLGRVRSFRFYIVLAFILVVFFETFRSSTTGVDTIKYVNFFRYVNMSELKAAMVYGFEPLFTLYVFLISRISNVYNVLFAVNAIIGSYAFIKFVLSRFTNDDTFIFLPLFILNYSYNLSSMRSSLAVAFLLLSIIELDKGNKIKPIIYSIISVLFHYSMIFNGIFVLYQIYLRSQIKKVRRTTMVLFTLLMLVASYIGTFFLQNFFIGTKYEQYVGSFGSGWLGQWNVVLAGALSLYVIRLRYIKKEWPTDQVINLLVLAFLPLYVRLNIYRVPSYYILCRISTYTIIGNTFEKSQDSYGRVIAKFLEFFIVMFGLLFYATRIQSGMDYHFMWESL